MVKQWPIVLDEGQRNHGMARACGVGLKSLPGLDSSTFADGLPLSCQYQVGRGRTDCECGSPDG
jgi:hypothetical protein